MNKKFLRKKYLDIRLNSDVSLLNDKTNFISQNLLDLLLEEFPFVKNIASYFPTNNEVNLLNLYTILLKNHYNIALPKIFPNTKLLRFYKFQNIKNMFIGQYNIFEPTSNEEIFPEIVIVPSIACDINGIRLGYGGGYYDYTLNQIKKTNGITVIAPCFDFQIVQSLPYLAHDQKVDIIVTEKNIIYV
ncbi:MAG: 5-formyltetrahydrofolate cyclo-ligase [Alphaproteobacteria bacterium]